MQYILKIQKNVPIPKSWAAVCRDTLKHMRVGDSFTFKACGIKSTALSSIACTMGVKLKSVLQGEYRRVWRTK